MCTLVLGAQRQLAAALVVSSKDGRGGTQDHTAGRLARLRMRSQKCFPKEVSVNPVTAGRGRWTAALRLCLDWLEGDIAPGLGAPSRNSEMDPQCTEAGKSGTKAKAEHLGVLQQGGEILMGSFLMLFLQG